MELIKIISNQGFLNFLGTFGLAVVLVTYFIFIRDPKRDKFWREKYDMLLQEYHGLNSTYRELKKSAEDIWDKQHRALQINFDELQRTYKELTETYVRLETDLRPEIRMISQDQATKLAYIGLDRDLYKLYYYMCEKLDGRRIEDIGFFIEDSIRDTNESWAKFTSPYPKVPRISDLYGVYKNKGQSRKLELEKVINSDGSNEDKKEQIWKHLVMHTLNMKREFDEFIHKLKQHEAINEYKEPEYKTQYMAESDSNSQKSFKSPSLTESVEVKPSSEEKPSGS